MARMIRSETDGTWHHVMNRGARSLPVFGNDRDRESFLALLGDSVTSSDAVLHGYALMPNHFHLLLEADVVALARVMKSLTGRYAQRFNHKYGYDGPLFRGRYRSKPVVDDRQLAATLRYIHRNPLPKGVARPDDLRWTSHPAYVGRRARPRWLSTSLLKQFPSTAQFDDFVLGADTPSTSGFASLDGRHVRSRLPSQIEGALGVSSAAELDVLRSGGRGVRNDTRMAALLLAYEHAEVSLAELSARYGYSSERAARSAVGRARIRARADRDFAALIDAAEARLRIHDSP